MSDGQLIDLAVELAGYGDGDGAATVSSQPQLTRLSRSLSGGGRRYRLADLQRDGFNTTPPTGFVPRGRIGPGPMARTATAIERMRQVLQEIGSAFIPGDGDVPAGS